MHSQALEWSGDPDAPLVEHLRFVDPAASTLSVGTGRFDAGQVLAHAEQPFAQMRSIMLVLEGAVESGIDGDIIVAKAGELVTIGPGEARDLRFLEDSRVLYLRFGHRTVTEGDG